MVKTVVYLGFDCYRECSFSLRPMALDRSQPPYEAC